MRRYRTYPFSRGATRPDAALGHDRATTASPHREASAAARILLSAGLLFLLAAAPSAAAAPVTERFDTSAPQRVVSGSNGDVDTVLRQGAPAVSREGTLTATVTVSSKRPRPLGYLEVRLRLRTPAGRLLYQKTQVRNEATGTIDFVFARSLKDLTTIRREGRYRLQVRVFTSGADPVQLEDRVLVFDPARAAVPLVVVARLAGAPMTDPSGQFVVDPAVDTATRDAAVALSGAVQRSRAARVSLAAPPYILDEWLRASAGYRVAASSGARDVPAGAPSALAYGSALKTVAGLVRDPRVELLDVPYGDPDIPALVNLGAARDLTEHYARALSSYRATIDASPSAGTAALCQAFPEASLPILVKRSMTHAILASPSLASTDTTGAGAVHLRGSYVTGLIVDEAASAAMATAAADPALVLDQLFAHRTAEGTPAAVVAVVPLGQGSSADAAAVVSMIDDMAATGWVRPLTAEQAASEGTTRTVRLARRVPEPGTPPKSFWPSVAMARQYAAAYLQAAGAGDPDARAANTQALLAQSRSWAGPLQDWSLAPRGRAYADAAVRGTKAVFDQVSVQVSDVTLSGSSGRIPVTVRNTSTKKLRVQVVSSSSSLTFPKGSSQTLTVGPGESFLTVPVDLGQALSGKVVVAVRVGTIQLAATSLTVTASFIDRLAIVGTIILVLVVLLFIVRRRVRAYRASSDPQGARETDGRRVRDRKDGGS